MIKVQCPRCKESFKAPDAYAGKTAQCPTCEHQVSIPIPAPAQLPTNQAKPAGKKQCPKCREWINEKATKCPYCQSRQSRTARAVGILIVSLLFTFIIIICHQSCSSTSSPSIGDVVSLRWGAGDTTAILGAINETAFDEMVKSVSVRDRLGGNLLLLQDRVIMLDAGTRARIIDGRVGSRQVRILDGPYLGRALWVVREVTLIKED